MIGLVITVVMGIIALTTAGVALHKETAEIVRERYQHSAELWAQQNKADPEIVNEIAGLRQAVLLLGGRSIRL